MYKAVCRRACFWQGHYWEKGTRYEGGTQPPSPHFEVTGRPAEEKGAAKKNEPDKKPDNEKPEGGK